MAKRKRHEEHENHERWLVSYADFITLLFAFFTVLYATAQKDVKKEQEFESSVRKSFNMPAPGLGGDGEPGGVLQPNLDSFPPTSAGIAEIREYVQRKLETEMGDEDFKSTVESVRHDAIGVRIQLTASAVFPAASATLKPESLRPLDKIAEMLKKTKRRIIVEGHTDNQAISTQQFPSNWELSAARATKIVRYFLQRHKIESKRVTAVAYADQRPLAPNTTEENRARNRRIEILIVTDESKSAL
jgi:chemotaxis protein MotB